MSHYEEEHYPLGTRFWREPARTGIVENTELQRNFEKTVHNIHYNNKIFNVVEAINGRQNVGEFPVMQYESMFLCGCEDEKIFVDVHKLAEEMVQEIIKNDYKEVTLLELGAGGMLGAYQVLTHILESCSLERVHLILSDQGYENNMWGTYRLLPLGYEADLPDTPRIFRTEIPVGTEALVLFSQDMCRELYITNIAKSFNERQRKYALTDENRKPVDYTRVLLYDRMSPQIQFGFKEDWTWQWQHTCIHSLLRLINAEFYVNDRLNRTWVDVSLVGSMEKLKKREQLSDLWGDNPNLLFFDVHMDYDLSQKLSKRLLGLYPSMHSFHAYDMQAENMSRATARIPSRIIKYAKRIFMRKGHI